MRPDVVLSRLGCGCCGLVHDFCCGDRVKTRDRLSLPDKQEKSALS